MLNEQKVINWFAVKSDVNKKLFPERDKLTQLRLEKLLYFAQGTYLSLYDEKLFDDDLVHADYGPLAVKAHAKYEGKRNLNSLINWKQALKDFSELNNIPKVSLVLNSVFNKYDNVTTSKLVEITQQQDPWSNTRPGEEMTPEALKDYFEQIVDPSNSF